MHNLAYRMESLEENSAVHFNQRCCVACGEEFADADEDAANRRAWAAVVRSFGVRHDDLLCGACGEYLSGFFLDEK